MGQNIKREKIRRKKKGIREDFFDDNRISSKITWALLAGIVGAILMAAGDWLMIYGDVTAKGSISWLTEGVAGIPTWRNSLAMFFAFPGIGFYAIALFALKDVFVFERNSKVYRGLTAIGLTPWLAIHLFYSMMLFAFAWLRGNGQGKIAFSLVGATVEQFWWIIPVGEAIMCLPFIYLFLASLTGKTRFGKAMAINNPLFILAILKGVTMLIGSSPIQLAFTNGLMSESMIIFFIIYIVGFCKIR